MKINNANLKKIKKNKNKNNLPLYYPKLYTCVIMQIAKFYLGKDEN